jgi:hypothetical protein
MNTSIILAHLGGHGFVGAAGVILLLAVLAMVALCCFESRDTKK